MYVNLRAITLTIFTCFGVYAFGNNLLISNVTTANKDRANDLVSIEFDISWDNSFRDDINYDAVWIFVKYRVPVVHGGDNTWRHVVLRDSGHIAPSGLEFSLAADRVGGFLQRETFGAGDMDVSKVSLSWNYGKHEEGIDNLIDDTDTLEVRVFGIEMIYVPQSPFFVGSGSTRDAGSFTDGSWVAGNPIPYSITSEDELFIDNSAGNLYAVNGTFLIWEICAGCTLSDNRNGTGYPKGFHDFYVMKYEMTQKQYADFLNTIKEEQAINRYQEKNGVNRYSISGGYPDFVSATPHRPVNFMSWMDASAYADWACLRPMTELEYEKMSRGSLPPFPGENATGTNQFVPADSRDLISDGTIVESTSGNVLLGDSIDGPLRSGWPGYISLESQNAGTRELAGASYYGIMELSGNLWEMCVSINDDAINYRGSHGDGYLSETGFANNEDWPGYDDFGVTGSAGAGRRGGGFNSLSSADIGVSNRSNANIGSLLGLNRDKRNGFRGVRTAQ